ncbi:MAG: P1 family peptidase [Candidatus Levybacteria bacterium]|nr:P1 family peptidase [Candidatus Levybacteria bacterium]
MNNTLTALKGIKVGHSTRLDKLTGCTFISFDKELPVAYKSYGGAPGTYATENLNNGMSFASRDGLFIAGGSLNGLTCAAGIVERLVEKKQGYKIGNSLMPAISGAIVWDLGVEIAQFQSSYGKEAVDNLSDKPVENGNVGAGTGTAVGKFQYLELGKSNPAMKAGVGSARIDLGNGIIVCALSVVNALGNVINPDGTVLAGNRNEKEGFTTFEEVTEFVTTKKSNTTISVVGINVDLKSRENYERIAHFGTQGQVRAISPVQTSVDGDTVFVFSTEEIKEPLNSFGKYWETPAWPEFTVDIIGQAVAKAVQESIYDACQKAETIEFEKAYKGVIPSTKDYKKI